MCYAMATIGDQMVSRPSHINGAGVRTLSPIGRENNEVQGKSQPSSSPTLTPKEVKQWLLDGELVITEEEAANF